MVGILAVVIGTILVFCACASIWTASRARALRRARSGPGYTREDFIAAFRGESIPEEILATVYDYYSSPLLEPGFPIAPGDSIEDDLLYVGEDREDQFLELLARLRLKTIPEYHLAQNGIIEVNTLRDLAFALDCVRRNQPAEVSPSAHAELPGNR
jgi:hypothetical protein